MKNEIRKRDSQIFDKNFFSDEQNGKQFFIIFQILLVTFNLLIFVISLRENKKAIKNLIF